MNEMYPIRMHYQKTGRAKYISHLDINRLMQRVLKRAKLPVWYTEGFNPHIYITFALPLSLGYESVAEYMDFRLTREMDPNEVAEILNQNMPEGICVKKVTPQKHKFSQIAFAEYDLRISSAESPQMVAKQWTAFLSAERIEVEKKTKRGIKTVDLKPDVTVTAYRVCDDSLQIGLRLPAGGEKNYNPSLLMDEFIRKSGVSLNYRVTRTAVFLGDGSLFE